MCALDLAQLRRHNPRSHAACHGCTTSCHSCPIEFNSELLVARAVSFHHGKSAATIGHTPPTAPTYLATYGANLPT